MLIFSIEKHLLQLKFRGNSKNPHRGFLVSLYGRISHWQHFRSIKKTHAHSSNIQTLFQLVFSWKLINLVLIFLV